MAFRSRADDRVDMVELIKERVEGGVYAVDSHRVAEAILARRGEGITLRSLWSEMLVAVQPGGGDPRERDAFAGHDPA